ncbi:hypothetical protein [Micromonospora sp. NPDC093277]|uniref:hypothetical protein n=1 Tax=Micromonospora sp. NPDC093277 TaxID=3364291 RepID=UPI00382A8D62
MRRLILLGALVGPVLRAVRRGPLLGAGSVGLAIVAVPAALGTVLRPDDLAALLRLTALCLAVGVAFVLDDPAKPSTATTPVPAWAGGAVRATAGLLAAAVGWAAAVAVTLAGAQEGNGEALPVRDLTLEATAAAVLALAFAVLGWARAPRGVCGPVAAPALLVAAAALALLPQRLAILASVDDPAGWAAAHRRFAVLLVAAGAVAVAGLALGTLPPRTVRVRRRNIPDTQDTRHRSGRLETTTPAEPAA